MQNLFYWKSLFFCKKFCNLLHDLWGLLFFSLMEKNFRDKLKNFNWTVYTDKYVNVYVNEFPEVVLQAYPQPTTLTNPLGNSASVSADELVNVNVLPTS